MTIQWSYFMFLSFRKYFLESFRLVSMYGNPAKSDGQKCQDFLQRAVLRY